MSRRITLSACSVLILIFLITLGGCSVSENEICFSADFESGNLPVIKQLDKTGSAWELALRDDNNNTSLPNNFRTWWYLRADNVPVQKKLSLEFSRLGFPYYFVPVYSYDQKNWHYFDENDVELMSGCNVREPDTCRLVVRARFTESTVWIARSFPYTTRDLAAFLSSVSESPYLQVTTLGQSPHFQRPIQLITITDPATHLPKQTIWIHARTHSAEVGPSFVLEGLIHAVLAEDALGRALRQQFIFNIVPMHNPDGVILGNYRTNASSVNLENSWLFNFGSPYLSSAAPLENRILNGNETAGMVSIMKDRQAPVVLALNLHSSNSDPDTAAFFFPHFGSDAKYSASEQNLWRQQLAFIKSVASHFDGRVEQPPLEGGSLFLTSYYPESWWWANKEDAVNAITLETTYGRAGFDHWITQDDLRSLGVALAKSINDLNLPHSGNLNVANELSVFRLPFKPEIYQRPPE
jgi:hypothetical protein